MNYYPHHIGDYASATAHLTMLEDCVYRRLLDWYYLDEKPIPADPRAIYRRIRASGEQEREAVDVVLGEFFTLTDDGYRHGRCDAEIARSRAKSDERREAANKRWSGRQAPAAVQTPCKDDANAQQTNAIASAADAKAVHSQEPIANSQEPVEKRRSKPASGLAPKPDGVPDDVWKDFNVLRRSRRAPVTTTAMAGIEREAAKAGLSVADALAVCCTQSWQGFNADWYANLAARERRPQQQAPPTQGKYSATIAGLTGRDRSQQQEETIDVRATEVHPRRLAGPSFR